MKKFEGSSHAERDKQSISINEQVKHSLAEGWPVVSVDTKKKELVAGIRIQDESGNRRDILKK